MKKILLSLFLALTATVGWAYEEMETCPFVHNINGVWYQIKDGEAWVSSRWHFGYELIILQDGDCYSGDVVIPETIQWADEDNPDTPEVEGGGETYPVVGIMEGAFYGSENLTSVSIPHSVRTIENIVFSGCTNLTEITFPSSVESIGAGVCEYCSGLKRVIIEDGPELLQWNFLCDNWTYLGIIDEVYVGRPYKTPDNNSAFKALPIKKITFGEYVEEIYPEDVAYCNETLEEVVLKGVKRIGRQAFDGNWMLQSVTLNEGIDYIDDGAFNFCGMSTITLPSTLIHIGNSVFMSCTNLTEISIPASVEYTGASLFDYCSNLRKVTLEDGPNLLQWNYLCYNGAPESIEEVYVGRPYKTPENNSAFRALPIKKITFGGYVEEIYAEDVAYCSETLETVILGKGIKWIAGNAFEGDWQVNQLYVKAVEPPYVDGETLGNISPETCTLYVPKSSLEAYKAAPVWKDFFNIQGTEDEPLTTTVTLYGFDGLCNGDFYDSQNNYKVPDGVYIYVVTGLDYDKRMTISYYLPDGIIPKGVAVGLQYEGPNATVITLTSVDEATPYTGTNWLFGSDVETITTAPYEAYFKRLRFGKPGSADENEYAWRSEDENGSPFLSEAHRAWLAEPKEGSSIKSLFIGHPSTASDCYYDLQGRKVKNPQTPGIYIRNGKKMIIRQP
ncbi:MAG: leucine-rich repeat domain-containing protein [Bacteroidales bacterium]|nr:leucine-rich repeat domain-containing protein [Bacteroidales bacterium]